MARRQSTESAVKELRFNDDGTIAIGDANSPDFEDIAFENLGWDSPASRKDSNRDWFDISEVSEDHLNARPLGWGPLEEDEWDEQWDEAEQDGYVLENLEDGEDTYADSFETFATFDGEEIEDEWDEAYDPSEDYQASDSDGYLSSGPHFEENLDWGVPADDSYFSRIRQRQARIENMFEVHAQEAVEHLDLVEKFDVPEPKMQVWHDTQQGAERSYRGRQWARHSGSIGIQCRPEPELAVF
ncbi:MAG: hypothetical protein UU48_C0006G0063 [Candidatus Uhrbacteria bacterium GW2011_GWF2_41_16]|uniref:Uncharacterized protein n=2 Tax=Candidatus Uhriibacteriota TaxID=1752732 RepID=A0A0G0VAL5_9BACT|nr:MAG: hypothetical protein UU35_C0007G0070 [Candidatus Uhrbacteria bacterium GW2011_GWC2_41_11]KKR98023.1 MAG: hypothetical protein UU48_C0006G0063 [Candidatus Uhrbacteria bacterium GW2011_GWF2_41_16]